MIHATWEQTHILTDKKGIQLSSVIASASTHDFTVAIDKVDSVVIKDNHHQR